MKTRFYALLLILTAPLAASADDGDARMRQLIDEALEVTGALRIGEQMSALVVAQMTSVLKSADDSLPDRAYDIMESEVNRVIGEEMRSGRFNELMYPIYSKYLNENDLKAMVAFYRTDEGKKIASILPQMTQEAMVAGQTWGAGLGPKIVEGVSAKLAEEGIEFP